MSELRTADEVAAALHMSRRTLRRRLAEHPEIRPIRAGRSMLFDRRDFEALKEALRECPSTSSPRESASSGSKGSATRTASGSSAARSTDEALRSLRKRETSRLLSGLRPSSNTESGAVVSLDLRRK
jgi:excisionase family DNA binding protein